MDGRDKILSSFTPEGTGEFGVVASYDTIFIRDHWPALTQVPWWYAFSGEHEMESSWARDYQRKSGLEWIAVHPCRSRNERARQRYEQREDGMWLVDEETGESKSLLPPTPGGTNTACASPRHSALDTLPNTQDDIDVLVPLPEEFNRERFLAEGRQDAARAIEESTSLFLYAQIASPLWRLYKVLGYEGMMILLAENPQLASYAAERISAETIQLIRQIAALGVKAAWIEECLTDQISPALYRRINIPLLRRCVEEIKAHGMLSIYYYCGNPNDRFEDILDSGADALHLEESKKGFQINIEDIAERVKGRCVLFGNLDTIGVLQNGSEETLRFEINRQLNAGRKCGGRFIMSTGSPIPPETPVERVRLYTDLARELGKPS